MRRGIWYAVAVLAGLLLLVAVTSRIGVPSIVAVSPHGRQGGSLHAYCWGSRGLESNCGSPAYEPPGEVLVMPAPWRFRVGYGSLKKARIHAYAQDTLLVEKEAQVDGREIAVDPALPPGTYLVRVTFEGHGDGARSVSRNFRIEIPGE